MGDVEKVKVKIDGDSKGLNKALDKSSSHSKGLEKALMGAKFAAAAVFAAVGAGAVASVLNFAKFDHSIRGVKTLLDETSFGAKGLEKGFAKMRKEILNVGRTTPVEIDSLNKALFDTVSAGVDAGAAVDVVAASARLAVAGLTDVSVATDGMTSAMNAYAFEAEEAELVSAKFFAAQKAGKTTIAELSGGFGLVGASAQAAGVSFNELLAAVSAVTLGGVKTNMAYTGLKAVLANIAKPTADAAKEAKRLGIEFNASALRAKGLKGFMDELRNSNKFTKDSVTRLFGSIEAQGIAFALTGTQADSFGNVIETLGDKQGVLNTLTGAYAEQADSMQNKWKLLTNRATVFSIQLGEKLAPTLIKAIDYMSDLFDIPATETRDRLKEINAEMEVLEGNLKKAEARQLGYIWSTEKMDEAITKLRELSEEATELRAELATPTAMTARLKEVTTEMTALVAQRDKADQGITVVSDEDYKNILTKLIALQDEAVLLTSALEKTPDLSKKLSALDEEAEARRAKKEEERLADLELQAEHDEAMYEQALVALESNKLLTAEEYEDFKTKLDKQAQDKIKNRARSLKDEKKFKEAEKLLRDASDKQTLKSHQARRDWDAATNEARLNHLQSTFGQIAAMSRSENSKLAAIGRAAAIAQATMSTYQAINKTLAFYPAPFNFALAAAVGVAGFTNVAKIAGMKGFAKGGVITEESEVITAHKRELIAPARNFDEVVESTARGRGFVKEDETAPSISEAREFEVTLSLNENLIDFVEAQINERRSLGVSTI